MYWGRPPNTTMRPPGGGGVVGVREGQGRGGMGLSEAPGEGPLWGAPLRPPRGLQLSSAGTEWNIYHRPLVSIQLCLMLPTPSSSSSTCIMLFTFLSPGLFPKYSLIILLLNVPAASSVRCSSLLAMLSSFLLNVCPSRFIIFRFVACVSVVWSYLMHTIMKCQRLSKILFCPLNNPLFNRQNVQKVWNEI